MHGTNFNAPSIATVFCKEKSIGTKSTDLSEKKVSPILGTRYRKKYLDTVSAIRTEYRRYFGSTEAMLWYYSMQSTKFFIVRKAPNFDRILIVPWRC